MTITQDRLFGIILVAVSAVLWSTAGLFVRMADMDVWSIVGWRSAFSFVTLGLYVLIRNHAAGPHISQSFGLPGLVACVITAISGIAYIASLQWTTVANVMTIYATLPFLASAIAFVWLRERITQRFFIAGLVAFVGVALTVGEALRPRDLLGIFAAFLMTLLFASQLVAARRFGSLDTTRVAAFAAGICTLAALPFMQWQLPAPEQLLACALYGVLTTGVGYVLVLMGSRLIGSGDAGLISLLDVVLGPLWVWVLFDERVGPLTMLGGLLVLGAVIWYIRAPGPNPALGPTTD